MCFIDFIELERIQRHIAYPIVTINFPSHLPTHTKEKESKNQEISQKKKKKKKEKRKTTMFTV